MCNTDTIKIVQIEVIVLRITIKNTIVLSSTSTSLISPLIPIYLAKHLRGGQVYCMQVLIHNKSAATIVPNSIFIVYKCHKN